MPNLNLAMRFFILGVALLAVFSGGATAQSQDRPFEQTYRAIMPQPVEAGDRIEVIDFFWYG
jgi:hypothetical protein